MSLSRLPLAAVLLLAGCVSAPPSAPTPAPAPAPMPAPRPAPPPPVVQAGTWEDWPLTPGDWVYRKDGRGSLALYGRIGAGADFIVRCDGAAKRIFLSRAGVTGAGGGQMTVLTSAQTSAHAVRNTGGQPAYVAADVAPADPLLDRMAFSRGRFVVQLPGTADLVIPAWPEFSRVVEDCRA